MRGDAASFNARLIYIADDDEPPVICGDRLTWYGATRRDPNRALEYRLYYKSNPVTELINEGDFFLIAKLRNGDLLLIFAQSGGSVESQLRVLFGIEDVGATFIRGKLEESNLVLPLRLLLEDIGIEFEGGGRDDEIWLEKIVNQFGSRFPSTKEFSLYARQSINEVDPLGEPDEALMAWMEQEEYLFRIFERHLVADRLEKGFGTKGNDVDEFINYSLSIQNRRKSRVGHAFESHLEAIFSSSAIRFERGRTKRQVTENNSKPDFIFPSFSCYHDSNYPSDRLFLLGAKTTCKDRWRQVLSEGARVSKKHLVTMEAAISKAQTDEMKAHQLQLVVPRKIQSTFSKDQVSDLQDLSQFIVDVKVRTQL